MKLKTAANIEKIIKIILFCLIIIPIKVIAFIPRLFVDIIDLICEQLYCFEYNIGNRLLNMSEEVKNGVIKNDYYIKSLTAIITYNKFKKEYGTDS